MYQKGLVEKNITFFRLAPGSPKKPKWAKWRSSATVLIWLKISLYSILFMI